MFILHRIFSISVWSTFVVLSGVWGKSDFDTNSGCIGGLLTSSLLGGYERNPQPLLFGLPATPSSLNDIVETSKQEAQHWLDRIKQQLSNDDENKEVKLRTEVIIASEAMPAEIVDYAQQQNVNLIVVGTKGRSGVKRLLLGSVTSGVVTYAHCPVLVVRWNKESHNGH